MDEKFSQKYPEVNSLSLSEAREARKLALLNYDAVKEEFKAELSERIEAIENRIARLIKTQATKDRMTLALGRFEKKYENTIENRLSIFGARHDELIPEWKVEGFVTGDPAGATHFTHNTRLGKFNFFKEAKAI